MTNDQRVPLDDVVKDPEALGFQRIDVSTGLTFHKANTVVIVPMREPFLHVRFHQALSGLISPPNQAKTCVFAVGQEVGHAYNNVISNILNDPVLSTWQYILTIEDDNLPPPDAHIRLIESINSNGGYDAVGALYWTKGDFQMPMAYGDPDDYAKNGVPDFRPLDVKEATKKGYLVPCQGLAMGCTLWRMDLFRDIGYPWFVTAADWSPNKGAECYSQDLFFCKKAVMAGKRFACDCRIKVSHMDWKTGIAY